MYYETQQALNSTTVSFLLGPRKCGKTVCLQQLSEDYNNAVYINVKSDYVTDSDRRSLIDSVIDDIKNDSDRIYLIDEATYLSAPDKDIAKIADALSQYNNSNTRIIFAGSQSKALEFWGHIAFAGNASFIQGDFLSYPEWLDYKGIKEVSEETYIDYISNTREFYKDFVSTKDYLYGCLDETVVSNNRSVEYVLGNDIGELDSEMLLDTLYAALISLHNHTRYETFVDSKLLSRTVANQFAIEKLGISDEVVINRATDLLSNRYNRFKTMDAYDCKKALQFLSNCGLITLSYVTDDLNTDPYITSKILKDSNDLYRKPDIFEKFNITINYPMFIVDIVSELLKDKMPNELPRTFLGSIVECHVRSMLPSSGSIMFRTERGEEIDYVSLSGSAIECSVRNKKNKDTHFHLLPESFDKILLTKDSTGTSSNITRIPYYEYIYNLSSGAAYNYAISSCKNKQQDSINEIMDNDTEPDPTDDSEDIDP